MSNTLLIRSKTALIFGIVMMGFLLFSHQSALVLIGIIFSLCAWEYLSIIVKPNLIKRVIGCILILLIVLSPLLIDIPPNALLILVGIGILFQLYSIVLLYTSGKSGGSYNLITTLLYLGIPGMLAISTINELSINRYLLLFIFILIWVSDSAAYLVGSNFGKRKLFPSISPNKSIEGFLGAGAFTIVASFLISYYSQFGNATYWLGLGLILWVFGTYGDLIESAMKRQFGIKDSGNMLPGHGGFLDRFDSFIYIWPCLALFHWILNI